MEQRPRLTVEQKIRAAQARGEFDNLPGAGKPLPPVDIEDPNWWVKDLMRREKIDTSALIHPTIALRREAEGFPESLRDLRTEAQVRAVLEDFNERVRAEWRRPAVGPSLPVVARPVNVERLVARWHGMRELEAEAEAAAAQLAAAARAEASRARKRRLRWRLRRTTSRTASDQSR